MPFLLVRPEPNGQKGEPPEGDYRFDYWLGDDLVGSPPALLVTDRLRVALEALRPAPGFRFEPARVAASAFFRRSNPKRELPAFWLWRFEGRAGVDDAGLLAGRDLVVSGRVFAALLSGRLEQAEIVQFRPPVGT